MNEAFQKGGQASCLSDGLPARVGRWDWGAHAIAYGVRRRGGNYFLTAWCEERWSNEVVAEVAKTARGKRIDLRVPSLYVQPMGAQWKQAGRVANATKRGQMIGKLVRELMVAAKLGGADPDLNARLHAAMEAARKASVPRDTIDRAVKKGAGLTDEKIAFELVTYEGFAPHKVPVVVECLTDNRNRTAPEIRNLFKTGQLGNPGSVAFFFDHAGVVEAVHPGGAGQDFEAAAIEAGAQNVEALEASEVAEGGTGARFITEIRDLDTVSKALKAAGWKVQASELRYLAKNFVDLPENHRREVVEFLGALDDHDDVHRVYAAVK